MAKMELIPNFSVIASTSMSFAISYISAVMNMTIMTVMAIIGVMVILVFLELMV